MSCMVHITRIFRVVYELGDLQEHCRQTFFPVWVGSVWHGYTFCRDGKAV